jgi:Laminin G domain.
LVKVRPECGQCKCILIAVVDGILEFSFELGSGPAVIQTPADVRVDDGKRHHVVLRRQASDGSIELDSITEFGVSQGILKMLNTRGNIYIGKSYCSSY